MIPGFAFHTIFRISLGLTFTPLCSIVNGRCALTLIQHALDPSAKKGPKLLPLTLSISALKLMLSSSFSIAWMSLVPSTFENVLLADIILSH